MIEPGIEKKSRGRRNMSVYNNAQVRVKGLAKMRLEGTYVRNTDLLNADIYTPRRGLF